MFDLTPWFQHPTHDCHLAGPTPTLAFYLSHGPPGVVKRHESGEPLRTSDDRAFWVALLAAGFEVKVNLRMPKLSAEAVEAKVA
jgi:hypothetical protein